ncbi:MAG: ATP-binding protein [Candidatus Nanoarchaeia archaeon]
MKIVVASGKGGVGKSMLASTIALMYSKKKKIVACDCDVDAPNLGLWLGITEYEFREKISTSEKAFIIKEKCIQCGKCEKICNFKAIEKREVFEVNPFLCEGCGACELVCPTNAIKIKAVNNGEIRINKTKYEFPLISGKLYPGETGSGKIVEELKRRVEEFSYDVAIFDSPAGIGCPVIASVRGTDYAILVTEPTPSGFSDLKRILGIVNYFQVPYGIVINKWDINAKLAKKIERLFKEKFLGKISYDKKIINSIVNLNPIIFSDSKVVEEIKEIFEKLEKKLKELTTT